MGIALAVFLAIVLVFGGLGFYALNELVVKPRRRAEMLEQRKQDLNNL